MKTDKPAFELILTRVIDAPRERVFDAWSKPEHVSRWFAPSPLSLPKCEMDFRSGGKFRMAMRAPDGQEYPFTGTYREIERPSLLVWVGEFPNGPAEQIRTEIRLEAQGQKTKLTMRQTFSVVTPDTEHATKGAKQGWTATLDQLTAFCESKENR
jgi:uncharacterized protein YndB with AHSA1/START domain